METPYQIMCFILFIFEGFFALAYVNIALSIRGLPLKDMARLQNFFLFASLTAASTSQIMPSTTALWILEILLLFHHFYCYITWETSNYCKKMILWCSLNWTGSRIKELPLFLGTMCAAVIHGYHAYLLTSALDLQLLLLGLVGVHSAVFAVLYNSRLAWASPSNIPEWIAKRVEDSKSLVTQFSSKKAQKQQ